MDKKILSSSDPIEIIEGLEEDIYKDLIKALNETGRYQMAIDKVQKQLKTLIKASPHSRSLIKKAADHAGEGFLKTVGKVKDLAEKFRKGQTVKIQLEPFVKPPKGDK